MSLGIYLNFNGNAKDALAFYQHVFDAPAPQTMFFKDMPPNPDMPIPAEIGEMVMHAYLNIGEEGIMFADMPEGMGPEGYKNGNNVCLSYIIDDADRLSVIYERLIDGGQVIMPLGKTFFADAYAYVVDRFGNTWHISVG